MKDMTDSYKLLIGSMAEIKIQHINLIGDECSACSWLGIKIRLLVCTNNADTMRVFIHLSARF